MPKTKKDASSTSDSDSGPDDRAPPSKKSKDSKQADGDARNNTWILDKNRQIRINEFRGRKLVDIREYYDKNGETLPGKKGISLSISQWKKLLEVAKEVTEAADK